MIISFCGHSNLTISTEIKENLATLLNNILSVNNNCTFYLGGYGNFDYLCLEVLNKLKKEKYPLIKILFITPYLDENYLKNKNVKTYYDNIIYPPLENVPKKFAILKRNMWIIKHSNLVIAYITKTFGGAYKTLEYAIKNNVPYINLSKAKKIPS